MQGYLRFFLIGTPSQWPRTDIATNDYRLWAWHTHHRQSLRVWAFVSVTHMLLFLRDIEGTPLRLHVYAMILLAVCLSLLTSDKAPLSAPAASTWARRIAVLFSVMQSVVTAHVAFGVNVNGGKLEMMVCSRWLDMATNMIVAVPCLALADMSVKSWLALACMSIFVSTPFYISVQGYSLPMAVFKAAVVQGLILIAYSCIERPKCAAYARLYSCTSVRMQGEAADANWRAQNKCASLGKKPPPSSSSFIISPELSPSLVGADPEASAHSKQPSPVDSRGKLPPVENMKGRKYRSMLRRTTVSVKLHSNFGPEVVHDGMAKQLSDAMMTAFPGTVIMDMAARRGCLILSMDLCELQQTSQQQQLAGQAGTSQEELVQRALQQWIHEAGLGESLRDGTRLSVQVGDCVRACTWNMHAHAWDQEAEYRCSNSEQNSIVVPSIALIYPSCLPPSGVKRVRTEQHQHQQQVKACAAGIQEPIPSGQLVEQQLMLQGQGSGHHHHHQQQQQQQQHMQLNFKAYVTAPSAFWLSGWHGNEEGHIQEGADGGDELQLLAHSYGRYLPVDIVQQGTRDETGAQRVQVCVSLPPHMKAFDCCQLRLEVVRGSSLLCNCNTMLVSSALAPVLLELEAWAKSKRAVQDHVSLFVDDLAEWLSFQSLVHTTCTDSARTAQGLCGQGSTMAIINNNSSSVSSGSSLDSSARAVQGLCGQGSNRPACSEEGTRCKGMGATQGGRNAVLGGNGGTSGGKQPATADVMGSKRPVCDEEGAYSAGVGPRDSLYGSTQDGTHGGTPGSTHCSTHGNTHGSQGSTHCSTHGNTHGNTGGSTQDSTCGSTHSETHGGPCSHVDSKTHGSRRPSAPSFLAALAEEALRPEVLQMMAQVGMDLLQHAVSWGMVHLAERILSGLLAPPLSVPFTTIAASDSSTSDTGVEPSDSHPPQAPRGHPKGSDVGVEPADSWSPPLGGSLLERALRCGNVHMLACVLEWGRMHGGLEVAWVPSPHHPIEDCHAENQPASRQLLPDNSTCAFNVPAVGTPAVGTPSTPHHPTEDCHEENEAQVGQPVPGASGASSSSLQPASRQLPPDNGACAFNAPAVDTPSPAVSTTAQPQCTLQASPFSACNVGSTNASLASPFSACNVCSTSTSLASPFSAGNASDSSKLKPSPGVGTGAAVSGAPCHPSPFSAANVCAVVSSTNPDQPPGVCASAAATGNPSVSAPACEAGPSTAAAAAAGAMPGSNWTSTSMLRVLWYGFDGRDGIHEDEYRQWCLANSAGLANKCCMGVVPFFWAGAVQSTRKGLFKSAITMGLYPIPMLLALLTKSPKKRERYMFLAKVTHYTLYIIFGLGLLPTIVARKLAVTHLDLIVEVVLYRLMEQVQVRALLVERAASTIGSSMLYSRLQFQHPLLQALAVNFASLCVGIALDVRNRRMHMRLRRADLLEASQQQQQQQQKKKLK